MPRQRNNTSNIQRISTLKQQKGEKQSDSFHNHFRHITEKGVISIIGAF